jgi:hypothetical protein
MQHTIETNRPDGHRFIMRYESGDEPAVLCALSDQENRGLLTPKDASELGVQLGRHLAREEWMKQKLISDP